MESHKISALMRHAYSFPEGKVRTSMMEEAVKGADLLNDLDLQFIVRMDFIQAAARSDDMPKMMAAVAWCQGVYDDEPERFDLDAMLAALATAVNCAASIHQLTRQQCDEMHADYKRRLLGAGYDLESYHQKRAYNALWMGDFEVAKEHFHRMCRLTVEVTPWDMLFRSDYYFQMGQVDEALREAKPILNAKDDADGTFHWASSFLLSTLYARRKRWRASRFQKRAYKMLKGNPDHIELIGHHLVYFSKARKWAQGIEMLESHLQWALDAFPHRELFEFYVGAWRLCRDAAAKNDRLSVKVPDGFPDESVPKTENIGALAEWMQRHSESLAEAFNARNGNSHFTDIIQQRLG